MFGHQLLKLATGPGERRFARSLSSLETVQRENLSRLLAQVAGMPAHHQAGLRADMSWEQFAAAQPVTDYEHWRDSVEGHREKGESSLSRSPVSRFQPTSGSTSAIKWVPYSKAFLGELDNAISPWVVDLYRQFPRLKQGRHYWSMSWVPTSLRDSMSEEINDDLQLMSLGKRLLAGATQSVPQNVSMARTSDDSLFATLAWLAADSSLSMMSIWSPTFGLGLLKSLALWRHELAAVLASGEWGEHMQGVDNPGCPKSPRAASLLRDWDGSLDPQFFAALWPSLALVSAWDTAASGPWAKQLHALLPQADFQGKGLWATEGVVTIPYQGEHTLAYRSHVYEFQDPDDGTVYAPWELSEGQRVMPLLSTGSGLLRYKLKDLVLVEGFNQGVPILTFLGRAGTTDLVGEKLTAPVLDEAIGRLDLPGAVTPVCTVAVDDAGNGKPGYLLLLEGPADQAGDAGQRLEAELLQHFHYQLARNLGQLEPVRCVIHSAMRERYLDQCRQRGMIEGNIKMESLQYWPGPLPGWLMPVAESSSSREEPAL
ncbi:GH3 auxin-responsive promoter family protein [Alcanivorax sp. S6407]|uniref:GH3 family domain-containing protein n=1 Tax=Alcanivorax sp. S6407 TaxID=2926424 RepID=UPI001FF53243|nr:GH3 auxin-responsive promoter family protein [Alcanivorax sp. S6407]MCK0152976.1 GH3 auxin-responsive promoter family protein [Alcanivorax sp. S6407]